MQIKDFDEIENRFNEINICFTHLESLSKVLLDLLCNEEEIRDVESITSVLQEKITDLKLKFNIIEQSFLKQRIDYNS